jgi:hypothetical protein
MSYPTLKTAYRNFLRSIRCADTLIRQGNIAFHDGQKLLAEYQDKIQQGATQFGRSARGTVLSNLWYASANQIEARGQIMQHKGNIQIEQGAAIKAGAYITWCNTVYTRCGDCQVEWYGDRNLDCVLTLVDGKEIIHTQKTCDVEST